MSNTTHENNRRCWDKLARDWRDMRDRDGLWQRCPQEPELAFEGGALELLLKASGGLTGKEVCVVGSGDNYAAFALAGMGARVTSVDISQAQLDVAVQRAEQLGLDIDFIQVDAADMAMIPDGTFDLVCSTNGFFVWLADLSAVFSEVHRILQPGGYYVFYDIHPFQRPWKDQRKPLSMVKSYWETGPLHDEESRSVEFNWAIGNIFNALAGADLTLKQVIESPAKDVRFWEGHEYVPGEDQTLMDWKTNPRAGLPVWLTVAVQKGYT